MQRNDMEGKTIAATFTDGVIYVQGVSADAIDTLAAFLHVVVMLALAADVAPEDLAKRVLAQAERMRAQDRAETN